MSSNGHLEVSDNSVICLDVSQDSAISDEGNQIGSSEQFTLEKTLPPGVAPEGFIILDESIEANSYNKNESETHEKNSPMFRVIFKDILHLRQYQNQLKEFFQKLVAVDFIYDDSDGSEPVMKIWGKPLPDLKKNMNDTDIENTVLFTIDNTPGSQDIYNIPTYGKKFETVLEKSCTDLDDENKNDKAPPKMNCFNCRGDHNLRDCPQPRNHFKINQNRKEFTTRNNSRNTRYHADDDQRYKPGVLSPELRRALGLADNELPRHIFKMRIIGYPPGWLEEAKLEHSGLNLYNSEGNRERDPTEEVGEIFTPENKTQYDINKLHDFPGFNIPAPSGTRDAFWSAEQQIHHSKETMIKMMSSRKTDEGYKRKKLKLIIDEPCPDDVVEPLDMDIVNLKADEKIELVSTNGYVATSPPSKSLNESIELPPPCEIIDTPKLTKEDKREVPHADSPSLSELEKRKQMLLEQLNDVNSLSNAGTPLKSTTSMSIVETPKSTIADSTIILDSTPVLSSSIESTPKHGAVKSIEFGTPILQNMSEYTKLPSSENFSKDICDVIPFENLPGATGMYEKINGVLQKVRDVMSNDDQS